MIATRTLPERLSRPNTGTPAYTGGRLLPRRASSALALAMTAEAAFIDLDLARQQSGGLRSQSLED